MAPQQAPNENPIAPTLFSRLNVFLFTQTAALKTENCLRVGIIGAANIAPNACIKPASVLPQIRVVGVAARDKARAQTFATKYNIPKVYDTYEELVASDDIDVVYVPSPNGLHLQHTLMALRAGKHVMCEKPLASNEQEAREMAEEAKKTGKVLFEAFHYRYHPATIRALQIANSDEVGEIESVDCHLAIPGNFKDDDIRYNFELAGGTVMDLGCYGIHHLRTYIGTEPVEVVKADLELRPHNPQIDYSAKVHLKFPSRTNPEKFVDGHFYSTLKASLFQFSLYVKVTGTNGSVELNNTLGPSIYHKIKVTDKKTGRTRTEQDYGSGRLTGCTTYTYMWQAFIDAVLEGKTFSTTAEDGILNMRAIDMIYTAAGLKIRTQPAPKQ